MHDLIREASRYGLPIPEDIAGWTPIRKRDERQIIGILMQHAEDFEAHGLLRVVRNEGLEPALREYVERRRHTAALKDRAKEFAWGEQESHAA